MREERAKTPAERVSAEQLNPEQIEAGIKTYVQVVSRERKALDRREFAVTAGSRLTKIQ